MRSNDAGSGGPADRALRKGRGSLFWRLVLLLLVAVSTAALFVLRSYFAEDLEHQAIIYERTRRAAIWAAGRTLPGTPDLAKLGSRLSAHGVALGAPVMIRIFKREFELELWMQREGKFQRIEIYPVCRWSGRLGPKIKTGDAQAPEGFYTVDATALNPNSRWHRSFNLGFPNPYDREHGRTGSFLMVHGGCSSIGCYAMTNAVIDEIWTVVTAALEHGQKRFQVQVFPFRLLDGSLDGRQAGPVLDFWKNLKTGYDLFESEFVPPKVGVCNGKYTFEPPGSVIDGSLPIDVRCKGKV